MFTQPHNSTCIVGMSQRVAMTVYMPRNDFYFFRLFAEIYDYFGASPVSTTPAMHALPMSLTSVNNSSPVSTTPVSYTFTVLESFTGVNNTGKKLLTGVIDTGEAFICWCQWHRQSMYLPVSLTPAKHVTGVIDTGVVMHHWCHWYRAVNIADFAGVNDTGNACIAGVVNTVDAPVGPLAVRQCF